MITAIRLNEESVEILARLCQEYGYRLLFDGQGFTVIVWQAGWPRESRLSTCNRDVNVAVLQMAIKAGMK